MAPPRGLGMDLADTSEVMDDKEKTDLNNETMKDEFIAIETMKIILMGLAIIMHVVVIYINV